MKCAVQSGFEVINRHLTESTFRMWPFYWPEEMASDKNLQVNKTDSRTSWENCGQFAFWFCFVFFQLLIENKATVALSPELIREDNVDFKSDRTVVVAAIKWTHLQSGVDLTGNKSKQSRKVPRQKEIQKVVFYGSSLSDGILSERFACIAIGNDWIKISTTLS